MSCRRQFFGMEPGPGASPGANTPTGTVQPNAFPAKYSFDTSGGGASCSDFIVYPTGTAGSTTQSTIVAYNNLYSGCSGSGTVPSVYWSYNTGSAYSVSTSPVLSLDGTQVAFIQSNGTSSSLVLLTWAANAADSVNGPDGTLTTAGSAGAYQNCTAPCMYTMALSHNDTLSAPFYDYHGDTLYVGDDSGYLHQFTGVLNGVPAESGGNWPVSLGSNKLASPVYDGAWNGGEVFVGDLGGALHCVTSAGAIFDYGSQALPTGLGAIADAPLIDSSANYVIVFTDTDGVDGYSETVLPFRAWLRRNRDRRERKLRLCRHVRQRLLPVTKSQRRISMCWETPPPGRGPCFIG